MNRHYICRNILLERWKLKDSVFSASGTYKEKTIYKMGWVILILPHVEQFKKDLRFPYSVTLLHKEGQSWSENSGIVRACQFPSNVQIIYLLYYWWRNVFRTRRLFFCSSSGTKIELSAKLCCPSQQTFAIVVQIFAVHLTSSIMQNKRLPSLIFMVMSMESFKNC